jgi:hypothetical protein
VHKPDRNITALLAVVALCVLAGVALAGAVLALIVVVHWFFSPIMSAS